jgi:GNAT superfamily N-acetyltransferase
MKILHFTPQDSIPGFDAALLSAQQADEHLATEDAKARCSLWWNHVPVVSGETLGAIGHFQAEHTEPGIAVLAEALEHLQKRGCTLAVGPMNGNTWRTYRLVTECGPEPTFFMEPRNPDFYQQILEAAGFAPLAEYTSSLVTDLSRRDDRSARTLKRLRGNGITIRNLDPQNFEADLRRIFDVSVQSFTGNYLYTELSEPAFLAQYIPYRDKIVPDLVFLAEHEGKPVGYLFALPDYAEAMRGEPIRTVIGKTLAVLPGRLCGGLGMVLTGMLHERAEALGYARLIHALQHQSNKVRNMSDFFGSVMRRYTLYSRSLR